VKYLEDLVVKLKWHYKKTTNYLTDLLLQKNLNYQIRKQIYYINGLKKVNLKSMGANDYM
jgi:hypothetical protein